jgi:hypothetical protein
MSGVFLAVLACVGLVRRLRAGLVALRVIMGGLNGLIVILLLFSLWHAAVALGVRLTLAFFAITTVTSWIFEEIGVVTGLVYGPYHYTSTLGPVLGSVPVLIPLAWFMLVYPSYVLANLAGHGWPVGTPGGRRHLVRLAFIGAVVMTAWDLVVDPSFPVRRSPPGCGRAVVPITASRSRTTSAGSRPPSRSISSTARWSDVGHCQRRVSRIPDEPAHVLPLAAALASRGRDWACPSQLPAATQPAAGVGRDRAPRRRPARGHR